MAPKIGPWWGGYVFALSEEGYSYSQILKRCKMKGLTISKSGICKLIKRSQAGQSATTGSSQLPRKKRPAPSRTKQVINKVQSMLLRENPATQRSIAIKVGVSQSTVCRISKSELQLEKRHKPKVHKLLPRHILERRVNCRKLYERHLAGCRWKFVVTLDEAWVYLSDTNKPRAIYYRRAGSKAVPEWFRQCKESFSRGFMVITGYCHNGKLQIRKVDSKAKVNSAYYQERVLDHIYREEIPVLYGADSRKVWIHQDKASSHTSRSTVAYMKKMEEETGIRAIPFTSIPVKSPDASPMDFCGFGLLKRALGSRKPRTLDGLWKATKEEWERIDQHMLRRSLLQWKLRCRAITRTGGHQIEHNRWWRKGFS